MTAITVPDGALAAFRVSGTASADGSLPHSFVTDEIDVARGQVICMLTVTAWQGLPNVDLENRLTATGHGYVRPLVRLKCRRESPGP